jgi:recombination protein RecA
VVVPIESISTGIASLDEALGIGGLPRGRLVELFGAEASGKTTTALEIIASYQRQNYGTVFIDAEHALDPEWAKSIGVNMDKLWLSQPDSGDEALKLAEQCAETNEVGLIVIDSVAALIPQAELDGEVTDTKIASQAQLMSKAMRRLIQVCKSSKTTIIFINQTRMKIGVSSGYNLETTPGGTALKFYASSRIQVSKGEPIREKDVQIGQQTKAYIKKNKNAPPFQRATYNIYYGNPVSGVDKLPLMLEVAANYGVIEKKSSYYTVGGKKFNGLANAVEHLRTDPEETKKIQDALTVALSTKKFVVEDMSDQEILEVLDGDDTDP